MLLADAKCRLICPTRWFSEFLSILPLKNNSLYPKIKSGVCLAPSRSSEGRIAIVTDVGAGCDGRGCCAGRARRLRTAKPCGPDTPTLVSSLAGDPARRRRLTSPALRGERGISRNPSCRECRIVSASLWFLTRVLSTPCTRGCGCARHPAFPAPSVFRGGGRRKTRAHHAARMIGPARIIFPQTKIHHA